MTASRKRSGKAHSPAMLEEIADRFKALGEPARLTLLQTLQRGEAAVGELVSHTGLSLANVSKHLQLLHAAGFVSRRREGAFVYYALADDDVFALCDLVCGRVTRSLNEQRRALAVR